jgi:hypothetical protein
MGDALGLQPQAEAAAQALEARLARCKALVAELPPPLYNNVGGAAAAAAAAATLLLDPWWPPACKAPAAGC